MRAMEISRSGLDVEWRRLEIIAENLANAGTTRTALGEPYQAMRLVSGPAGGFAAQLGRQGAAAPAGVAVYGTQPTNLPPRLVYEPSHPHADDNGYVSYPGIDHAGEMTLMVSTARIYEANLVAMNIARQMYARALDLGKR
ncbi:flagellar basal body rod protein FlgC [Allosphingosinicella sp.]|jgi:flagellar basal-body rod protein FlgC|uniref:flagellar basal body rod protein FlgC n=1 Tax=Allosphingosinicella sp. TaxID=2823234 RepID=UPI002F257AF7